MAMTGICGRRRGRSRPFSQSARILARFALIATILAVLASFCTAASRRSSGQYVRRQDDDSTLPSPVAVDVAKQHVTDEMPMPSDLSDEQRNVKAIMKAGMPSLFSDSAPWGDAVAKDKNVQLSAPMPDASLMKNPEKGESSSLKSTDNLKPDRRPQQLTSLAGDDLNSTSEADVGSMPTLPEQPTTNTTTTALTNGTTVNTTSAGDNSVGGLRTNSTSALPDGSVLPAQNATPGPVVVGPQGQNATPTLNNQTIAQNSTTALNNQTIAPTNSTPVVLNSTTSNLPAPTNSTPAITNTTASNKTDQPNPAPVQPFGGASPFGSGDLRAAQNAQQNQNSSQKPTSNCGSLDTRRPWSQASPGQRQAYLDAIMCMTTVPGRWDGSRDGNPSHSMYEDWVLWHNYMQPLIHRNAALLPCHRLFVNVWYDSLRKRCGYMGDLLYMDWWTYGDQNSIWTSQEIWGNNYYGNADGLVRSGRFAGLTVNYSASNGDSTRVQRIRRPICRQFRTISFGGIPYVSYLTSSFVRSLLGESNYDSFRTQLELTFHQYLHVSIGCDLVPTTSPNCPTFFAIHTSVDYIWALWQEINNGANRFKYNGQHGDFDPTPASVTDTCTMLGMWSVDFNVQDLLDINSKPNCYQYQWSPSLGP